MNDNCIHPIQLRFKYLSRQFFCCITCCYDIVLTCINDCRSIVVIIYCLLFIVAIIINIILVMCDIGYCRSYSIYAATLYVDSGPVYCQPPACLACASRAVINRTTAKLRLRAWFEFDWQPCQLRKFRAYDLKLLATAKVWRLC